jgi:hypothetical protein
MRVSLPGGEAQKDTWVGRNPGSDVDKDSDGGLDQMEALIRWRPESNLDPDQI